ncbi:MAG TPA: sigma-70 family RNA polymerase sigma factor [Candidatus Polarisedimenticolia bacterium]|nr:sigma-70 family RNA polymerase sigma factor [Candidatus Polarisedimenticolia bacterium]
MEQAERQPTDSQLVTSFRGGEPAAFEEILRRYEAKVYSLVRGMTRNDADAQDSLQDTFLQVYRNIASFKGESSLSTWIYRIAVNSALMTIRKRRHDEKSVPIDEYMPQFEEGGHRVAVLPDWSPRADDLLLNKELATHLREAIAALDPEYRTVFVLRDQEGLSNEEVATILDLSVPAVKSRLHRARLFLRERIKRYWWGTIKPHGMFSNRRTGAAGCR